MKESIDGMYADIAKQYGNTQLDNNIKFILSLYEARLKEDGTIDDKILVPSVEAAVKTIILLVERPELPWETICEERRVKHVVEYLFIRAKGHYEEVHEFVKRMLKENTNGKTQRQLLTFLNIWDNFSRNERPSRFVNVIVYPEKTDIILSTLHQLMQDEVGRGAALVMTCARDEGLIRDIRHSIISTEFPHVQKTAYNNYVHEAFTSREKQVIVSALRTKIGYTKNEDVSLTFKAAPMKEKNLFYQLFRWIGYSK